MKGIEIRSESHQLTLAPFDRAAAERHIAKLPWMGRWFLRRRLVAAERRVQRLEKRDDRSG
jgi:hypothetical protein